MLTVFLSIALVEPLATCWRAVTESQIQQGNDVLIFGAGPIGLGVVQCCKARGARNIMVAEVSSQRQILAKAFGATHVFNPLEVDVVKEAQALSDDGEGPQISIDCAGLAATLKSACMATRPRGIIVNVAIWEKAIEFNPNLLVFGERRYHSGKSALKSSDAKLVHLYPASTVDMCSQDDVRMTLTLKMQTVLGYSREDFKGVINAICNGSLDLKPMITRTISINRVVEDGFQSLINNKDREVKIQIKL
jgi:threonine dehydrogenase-like Zn-dependent dehydrogenase